MKCKRIYEAAKRGDGFRILVDRLWPRGVSKAKAHIDLWPKDIAPSDALRKWFRHDYAASDDEHNNAAALKGVLKRGFCSGSL